MFIFHIFITYSTDIHSIAVITFTQSAYPSPFAEASLHLLITLKAQPRIELGPALQQADALPTEPRRTITEPRRTMYDICIIFYLAARAAVFFKLSHVLQMFSNLSFYHKAQIFAKSRFQLIYCYRFGSENGFIQNNGSRKAK